MHSTEVDQHAIILLLVLWADSERHKAYEYRFYRDYRANICLANLFVSPTPPFLLELVSWPEPNENCKIIDRTGGNFSCIWEIIS